MKIIGICNKKKKNQYRLISNSIGSKVAFGAKLLQVSKMSVVDHRNKVLPRVLIIKEAAMGMITVIVWA